DPDEEYRLTADSIGDLSPNRRKDELDHGVARRHRAQCERRGAVGAREQREYGNDKTETDGYDEQHQKECQSGRDALAFHSDPACSTMARTRASPSAAT